MKRLLIGALGVLSITSFVGLFSLAFLVPLFLESREHIKFLPIDDVLRPVFGGLGLLVTVGFVAYAITSAAVPNEKRALWIVVLLLGNILVLPFFWYWYIWAPSSDNTTTGGAREV